MNSANIIGRCVSRERAVEVLKDCRQFVPPKYLRAYIAALNRARFELEKRVPVEPANGCCGNCGVYIEDDWIFCANCGREIQKDGQNAGND